MQIVKTILLTVLVIYPFGFNDGSKQVYSDWKLEGHGAVDLRESLKQSCNVYFWDIALKIWRQFGNTDGESLLQSILRS